MTAKDEDSARTGWSGRARGSKRKAQKYQKTITVNRPAAEIYSFWRDLGNVPRFAKNVSAVATGDEKVSHWRVQLNGAQYEWHVETIEAKENEEISWRTVPGGDVEHSGRVSFRPAGGNRGTVVRFELEYTAGTGKTATKAAREFGKNAKSILETYLYRLKSLLETGEIPTVEGQPKGKEDR